MLPSFTSTRPCVAKPLSFQSPSDLPSKSERGFGASFFSAGLLVGCSDLESLAFVPAGLVSSARLAPTSADSATAKTARVRIATSPGIGVERQSSRLPAHDHVRLDYLPRAFQVRAGLV